MQNLHGPISCSCTATAPLGSQPHAPSVQCHHPSLTPLATTRVSWGKEAGYTQHATATAHRQEQGWGWTVMKSWLKTQIRHPRTGSYKLNLQNFTSALPAHPGPGEQLVSCEHVPRDSLQDTPDWRTPQPQLGSGLLHSFPKARGTHPINPKSGSWAGLGFVDGAVVNTAEQWVEQRHAASSKNKHIHATCSRFCTYCNVCT